MTRTFYFLSGMHPGPSGTGEWLRYIASQGGNVISGSHLDEPRGTIRAREGILAEWRQFRAVSAKHRKFIDSLPELAQREDCEFIMVHPQSMGLGHALAFMQARKGVTHYFLLDNSSFCIRSYNFIPGESAPCLRCVGGRFEEIALNGCAPFPEAKDGEAIAFERGLLSLVRAGRVKLMAQSRSSAALAERHFGVNVPVVGLWANGWDECLNTPEPAPDSYRWDVVFHGWNVPAKGADWMVAVAGHCPDLSFLMPFHISPRKSATLPHCTFQGKSWNGGLREDIKSARITAVPSLWSASIEGALFKSVAFAPAVAVVENDTAFSSEFPSGLALHLSSDPEQAAVALRNAVTECWRPDRAVRTRWLSEFVAFNRPMYQRVIDTVEGNSWRT